MQMQTINAPSARRLALPLPPPPAGSSNLSAGRCFLLRSPHARCCRRTRSIRASASLDQEVKERADAPSPSGK